MPKLTVKPTKKDYVFPDPMPNFTIPDPDLQMEHIISLERQLKEQEELCDILRKKVQEKPKNTMVDLDIDSILIFIQSLKLDEHPSLKSTLTQMQKYGKKALIVEVISIIKLWQAGQK
jgi:hypothetical protein